MSKTLEELAAEVEALRAENKDLRESLEQGERRPRTTAQIIEDWRKKLEDEAEYVKTIEKDFV